jgi:hypothetical protein
VVVCFSDRESHYWPALCASKQNCWSAQCASMQAGGLDKLRDHIQEAWGCPRVCTGAAACQ